MRLPLGVEGLGVNEALEALLLASHGAEGLGTALSELGDELGIVEGGCAEVVAVHLVYL
jgi:hypothetical protein